MVVLAVVLLNTAAYVQVVLRHRQLTAVLVTVKQEELPMELTLTTTVVVVAVLPQTVEMLAPYLVSVELV
jgi:hypothetical protein